MRVAVVYACIRLLTSLPANLPLGGLGCLDHCHGR
jgi:phage portal protein BeeE